MVAPLPAGRPAPQDPEQLLLLVGPSARWVDTRRCRRRSWSSMPPTSPGSSPSTRPPGHGRAVQHQSCSLTSPAGPGWRTASRTRAAGRRSSPPVPADGDELAALAPVRGHAVVLAAGAMPGLSAAAALLADARRHGPLPPVLIEASVMWRRLDELVVPVAAYDAACPRWHTPTLSERLEDLLAERAAGLPARVAYLGSRHAGPGSRKAWRRRAPPSSAGNAKAALLTEAVDADLRAGLAVDIALPSRTARDAVVWHLADVGVPLPADGQLMVRSLGDAGAWEPPRASVLVAPPADDAAAPHHRRRRRPAQRLVLRP